MKFHFMRNTDFYQSNTAKQCYLKEEKNPKQNHKTHLPKKYTLANKPRSSNEFSE